MSRPYGFQPLLSRITEMKNFCCNIRRYSSHKGKTNESLSTYSSEEQIQIIRTIQKCVLNNSTRPYLNEKRLQNLKPFFEQNSSIKNLEPLLSVNGIGPKLLQRICDSILKLEPLENSNQAEEEIEEKLNIEKPKPIYNLITPPHISQESVKSIVSIHLGINAVSWTRLLTSGPVENLVDRWDVMDFPHPIDKKFDVHSTWELVQQFRYLMPDGDIYVMENNNWSNVANVKKPMKYHLQEAMLTTAICSIFNQTDSESEERAVNRLYFIRTFIPSRLFNKVVGSERVSAQDIVLNMMEGVPDLRHQPVTFSDETANKFLALNGSQRDSMCRALLLAVSFVELIIRQNPEALAMIRKSIVMKKKS